MRCRWRSATTRRVSRRRRSGWRACAATMRRCGGSSSTRIFDASQRKSRRIGTELARSCAGHTTDFMRRRTICGPRCVRCRAAGCRSAISCCRRTWCSGMGRRPIAIELAARDTDRQRALLSAGVTVYRIEPSMFARLDAVLPAVFSCFWESQTLPSSPFRRAIPRGVLAEPVIASAAKQSPS